MRSLRRATRRTATALTAGLTVLAAAAPAVAATNNPKPLLGNWGVWKSCGSSKPAENCAQIRATAEDPSTDTLFAGGDFTKAVDDAGTASLPYNNLVPINETSGTVATTFAAHTFNGRIFAIAVDAAAQRVYVGGAFTRVDGSGTHAQHVAVFDASNGKLLNVNVRANGTVHAMLLADGLLYLGGGFTAIQGTARVNLAAVDPSTGTLSTSFVPPSIAWSGSNSSDVRALALGTDSDSSEALYVGGHFDLVGGGSHMSMFRGDPRTGALDTAFAPKLDVTANDSLEAVDGLQWVDGAQDGTPSILVAQAGHTNRAYRFDTTGKRLWSLLPNGDIQTVALSGSTVYFGGHFTCIATASPSCSNGGGVTRIHIVAVDLTTRAIDTTFKPRMDPSSAPYFLGVWTLELTADGTLWAGGVFKQVTISSKTYSRPKLAAFPPA